jgi:hypothetical protein
MQYIVSQRLTKRRFRQRRQTSVAICISGEMPCGKMNLIGSKKNQVPQQKDASST